LAISTVPRSHDAANMTDSKLQK